MYQLIDGKPVWALYATHGLPWEFVLPQLAEMKKIPTWKELFDAAVQDGANLARMVSRISDAVGDAYPQDVATEIRKRLPLLLELYSGR